MATCVRYGYPGVLAGSPPGYLPVLFPVCAVSYDTREKGLALAGVCLLADDRAMLEWHRQAAPRSPSSGPLRQTFRSWRKIHFRSNYFPTKLLHVLSVCLPRLFGIARYLLLTHVLEGFLSCIFLSSGKRQTNQPFGTCLLLV